MQNKTLVILAAGMGSRYGGNKQTYHFGPSGEMLLDYSIHDAILAGFNKIVCIIRQDFYLSFKKALEKRWKNKIEIHYVFQEIDTLPEPFKHKIPPTRTRPWGTAHALLCSQTIIKEPFIVINADDFYGREAFKLAHNTLSQPIIKSDTFSTILYPIEKTLSANGEVNRGICTIHKDNRLDNITETFKIHINAKNEIISSEQPSLIIPKNALVSMNFWIFHPYIFTLLSDDFPTFLAQNYQNEKAEFLLPSCLNTYLHKNLITIQTQVAHSPWFGVTYKEDATYVQEHIQLLIEEKYYPESL